MASREDRKDELLKYFNSKGYVPILLPPAGLLPPDVYVLTDENYDLYWSLADVVPAGAAAFNVDPRPVVEFNEQTASERNAKVSVGFFKSLLEGMGLGAPELKAGGEAGADAAFSFAGVEARSVPVGLIEDAMNTRRGLLVDKIGRDRIDAGYVHVAYTYLYAKKVNVSFGEKSKAGVELKAEIPEALKLELEANIAKKRGERVGHDGVDIPVAIAFKVARLEHDGKRWRLRSKHGTRTFGAGPHEGEERDYLPRTGAVLEIRDLRERGS